MCDSAGEAVLTGIAERLRAHGKTERFGVRLIRNPLGLNENEVLLETCDIAHRTLRCSVDERDGVSADNNVETTWQWKPSPGGTGPDVTLYCMMMCGSDRMGVTTSRATPQFQTDRFGPPQG